jgi:tRNA A-37 threonylcarbamoyl transferase component Bud32
MQTTVFINPEFQSLVRRYRLDDFDRVMNWSDGEKIGINSSRGIQRIDLDDNGRPITLFLKREWQTYLKDRLANWMAGFGWSTKARREQAVLERLAEAAIGCPEVVVMAERGGWRPTGYLVLMAIPCGLDLPEFLKLRGSTLSVAERRQLAAHLGHEIARMHAAGIDQPDLFSKHIFLSSTSPSMLDSRSPFELPRVSFIDLQRSGVRGQVSLRARLRDLASLHATLPLELASTADRVVFLNSYLTNVPMNIDRRAAIDQIQRRAARLAQRRKIKNMRQGRPPKKPKRRPHFLTRPSDAHPAESNRVAQPGSGSI